MNTLLNIYEDVIKEFQKDGKVDYEMYERYEDYARNVLHQFLYENNEDYTMNMSWRLVSFPRLKRIWEQHAIYGFVRDEKGLNYIANIMESNTLKLSVLTMLAGHTESNPDEYYDDIWSDYIRSYIDGIERPKSKEEPYVSNDPDQLEIDWNDKNIINKNSRVKPQKDKVNNPYFDDLLTKIDLNEYNDEKLYKILYDNLLYKFLEYYIEDPKSGQARISDYGLEPLVNLTSKLRSAHNNSQKIVIIDKMLNVVHQRSDMASWFVQGGSSALSDLSSAPNEQ